MLPLNRIYTPEEIRAAARLSPAQFRNPAGAGRRVAPVSSERGPLVALLQRFVARGGFRRPAPGTT
jgi:hypothetical protein